MNWYKVIAKLKEEAKAKRAEAKSAPLNKRPHLQTTADVLEAFEKALRAGMGMR